MKSSMKKWWTPGTLRQSVESKGRLRRHGVGQDRNPSMSSLGQKRPKLPWLPAAKSATEQRVKFVPKGDLAQLAPQKVLRAAVVAFEQSR